MTINEWNECIFIYNLIYFREHFTGLFVLVHVNTLMEIRNGCMCEIRNQSFYVLLNTNAVFNISLVYS